ncbi:MAG: hypothetical protein ACPGJS_11285 [Flammeovirgaceae bacterium]
MRQLLIIFFWTLSSVTMAQTDKPVEKDFDYINFTRYYQKAVEELEKGAVGKAGNFLKYANRHAAKLKKKGYADAIAAQEAQMVKMQAQIDAQKDAKLAFDKNYDEVLRWATAVNKVFHVSPYGGKAIWEDMAEFDLNRVNALLSQVTQHEKFNSEQVGVGGKQMVLQLKEQLATVDQLITEKQLLNQLNKLIADIKTTSETSLYERYIADAEGYTNSLLKINPNHMALQKILAKIQELAAAKESIVAANQQPLDFSKKADALPKAVIQQADWEQQFIDAIKFQKFPDYEVKSAILTSADWVLQKDVAGRTLYRSMEAVVVVKGYGTNAGKCFFQYFDFKQPYSGSGFGKAMRQASGQRYYIDCALVP